MSSTSNKIKSYIALRTMAFNQMSELKGFAESATDDQKILQFKIMYKHFDTIQNDFRKNHQSALSLMATVEGNDLAAEEAVRTQFEFHCSIVSSFYISNYEPIDLNNSKIVPLPANLTKPNVKLPKVEIPKFSGDIKAFKPFIDMFKSLVHENPALSDIEKFNYLVSFLQGPPLTLIQCTPMTTDNYQTAFQSLIDRYDNSRLIALAHLQTIDNTPTVSNSKNSKLLRSVVDTFAENIASLKNMSFPVEHWDFLLFYMLSKHLDQETMTRFEMEENIGQHQIPTFASLKMFVIKQCNALDTIEFSAVKGITNSHFNKSQNPFSQQNIKNKRTHSFFGHLNQSNKTCCIFCKGEHSIYKCTGFYNKNPLDRLNYAKNNNWCLNCLSNQHNYLQCNSQSTCRHCNSRHHSLLHINRRAIDRNTDRTQNSENSRVLTNRGSTSSACNAASNANANSNVNFNSPPIPSATLSDAALGNPSIQPGSFCGVASQVPPTTVVNTVLLSTAIVDILDGCGNYLKVRVLLDCGSQTTYISRKCFNKLGLKRFDCSLSIHGLGEMRELTSNGGVTCTLKPMGKLSPCLTVDAIILPKLCPDMPTSNLRSKTFWPHISDLMLADDIFHKPGPIDMILGADIYPHILLNGRIHGSANEPVAINTIFGWVLMGKIRNSLHQTETTSLFAISDNDVLSLDNTLKRFWELEEIPEISKFTPDEELCEKIFKDTHIRTDSGRYQVNLPFKQNIEPVFNIENSRAIALRRFYLLEKRLIANPELYKKYSETVQEYINSHYLESVSQNPMIKNGYYIPHHCVAKADKFRIVYDASAKTIDGFSLNDNLLIGPKLQKNIITILLNFRFHSVVFTCDIKGMFTQILVSKKHRDFQRILWRFTPQEPVKDYRLKRVTFGLSSSPFLANRTLIQLAEDEILKYPLAANVLKNDFYIDDCAMGTFSIKQAKLIRHELINCLGSGGFELRKWSSNSPEFLSDLPASHKISNPLDFDTESATIKILGLRWQPSSDTFSYNVEYLDKKCTKRNILSEIARIFDPLGFICPILTFAKQVMQSLFCLGLHWDEPPPTAICDRWLQYKSELKILENFQLPRRLILDTYATCELHGFCDASQKSYACIVYFRVFKNDLYHTFFVIAKSKVAPLKQISIPRLELCAALLLSQLLLYIMGIFKDKITFSRIIAWSDSTIALSWIKSPSYKWKIFVSNRVSRIQGKIPPSCWRHIPSGENPADCASRGLLPMELLNNTLWWAGPTWLKYPEEFWPKNKFIFQDDYLVANEERKLTFASFNVEDNFLQSLVNNFSSLSKIQNILCNISRFIHNCKNPRERKTKPFTRFDLNATLFLLIKYVQSLHFAEDISNLKTNKPPSKYLRKLNAFLDENDILRVGGRLVKSDLSYDKKHPAILPRNHRLTTLIIEYFHKTYLHPGAQTLHFLLVQRFWILSPRRAIYKVVSTCKNCWRLAPKPSQPPMGDLPRLRISQLKPFSCVGLDYAGYFTTTQAKTRGAKTFKSYVCLFVCFATKALHLELVSDLSTESFLCAFRRFISRRGRCSKIISDGATCFQGAHKQLLKLFKDAVEKEHIEWFFQPPTGSHFAGLAEAGVKSVKTHIRRVIGDQILTFEEFYTVLVQIEALLNSRPLCPISSDPNDLSVLTPGHFLTLEPLSALPDQDLSHLKLNRLDRWQLLQRLHQDFWKRWQQEYLHTLHQRGKWLEPTSPSISLGTMVLIKDSTCPPSKWRLGRILKLHPGEDGVARVATVLTQHGTFKRPLVKLCPLPYSE